jgi:acetoin utilization deacetylase AcuC-like enzyme
MFLEGGYDLEALRDSVAATLGAVLESPYRPEAPSYGGPGTEIVSNSQVERTAALRIAHEAALREEQQ